MMALGKFKYDGAQRLWAHVRRRDGNRKTRAVTWSVHVAETDLEARC